MSRLFDVHVGLDELLGEPVGERSECACERGASAEDARARGARAEGAGELALAGGARGAGNVSGPTGIARGVGGVHGAKGTGVLADAESAGGSARLSGTSGAGGWGAGGPVGGARGAGSVALACCVAIRIPETCQGHRAAQAFYREAYDCLTTCLAAHGDAGPVLARRWCDVGEALATGRPAVLLAVESASVLGHSVGEVETLAADGVRVMTLTSDGGNPLGGGAATTDGLRMFGHEAVRALEDAGIVVDAAHLSDASFADLLDVARRPFISSQAGSRAVHGHLRNLTDYEFCAIRDAGGIVGLPLDPSLLGVPAGGRARGAGMGPADGDARKLPGPLGRTTAVPGWEDGLAEPPLLDALARHVEHFCDLDGEDVVCLGGIPPQLMKGDEGPGLLGDYLVGRFGPELAGRLLFDNAHAFFARR